MRAANIAVGAIAALWFAIFLMGRSVVRGVESQGHGFAANAGQIDYYVIYPLVAVASLMFAGWVGNMWRKPRLALIPTFLIGFAILPFLLGYTGGM
jgi:hypothetical protein